MQSLPVFSVSTTMASMFLPRTLVIARVYLKKKSIETSKDQRKRSIKALQNQKLDTSIERRRDLMAPVYKLLGKELIRVGYKGAVHVH